MTDLTRRKKELLNAYNNLCSCYGDIISEQTKTINQFKELLKEAKDIIEWYKADCGYKDTPTEALLTKIDNAIGEKK